MINTDIREHTSAPLGIMAAMPEEINALMTELSDVQVRTRAGREFRTGLLFGRRVVLVFSRWGKVASASTATELILDHGVSAVAFFGIAGGLGKVHRGDIVVATGLVQHDLDASPYFPPTHVPMLGVRELPVDLELSASLQSAAAGFLTHDLVRDAPPPLLAAAEVAQPRVHRGVIASGDQVIFTSAARERVLNAVPNALCVEMEGAAVAQVCFEHGVAFACVRTISDGADESGDEHIKPFFHGLAGVYTHGVVKRWLGRNA
jgi:adenosylhomocysteine nucleosidase